MKKTTLPIIILFILAAALPLNKPEKTDVSERDRREVLQSLGYLQGYAEIQEETGVLENKKQAYPGYNFFTSGHMPAAYLMDMQGNILHTWKKSCSQLWDDCPPTPESRFFRRAKLLDNASILAIFNGIGLAKLGRESKTIWKVRAGIHHDLDIAEDKIYTLTSEIPATTDKPKIPQDLLQDDYILILSKDGEILGKHSLLKLYRNSDYQHIIDAKKHPETFHTNSIRVLDGTLENKSPHFKKGNLLLSHRNIHTIAIADLKQEKIVWANEGAHDKSWQRQHEAILLENGRILIFDNLGKKTFSRVIEYDITNDTITCIHPCQTRDWGYSMALGASQRLPNANTLTTISEQGKAIETTPDEEIVWSYTNPHTTQPNTKTATILHMKRISKEDAEWLKKMNTPKK